jgi:ATP-dependent DNA helicase RecQ
LLKWGHDRVSTYGIGKEHSRTEWQAIGRELVRLGLLRQTAEKFSTIELTDEGRDALRTRRAITLTRPMEMPVSRDRRDGDIVCDEALFERLRVLRKRLADERDVPAYVIFSDVALRLMARDYPTTDTAFARIAGVGEKKRREFGPAFLGEVAAFLEDHPKKVFAEALQPWIGPAPKRVARGSAQETYELFQTGKSLAEVAKARGLNVRTVVQHLAEMIVTGHPCDARRFFSADTQARIEAAFAKHGLERLAPVRESLGPDFDYDQLNLCRALIQARLRDAE